MWTLAAPQLLLASESARRLELLRQMHIPVESIALPAQAEDEPRLDGESVIDYVTRTSADKNTRARAHIDAQLPFLNDLPILTGDTTVALGQTILGKPQDNQDAIATLHALSGQTHDVYSAVTLSWRGQVQAALSHTRVSFAALSDVEILAYVSSGEPQGKAGAYGIQGLAAAMITRIDGSYSGVMGLPIYETMALLSQMGLLHPQA